jgi:hypothetical protein
MDILPIPHNPTSPTAKVPYVCRSRYDGLAFLTYPARIGRPEMVLSTFPPGTSFGMREKAQPTPVAELESLYQTWLYFGLIFEFLNVIEDSPGMPPRTEGNKEEEMDAVYQFFIVENEEGEKTVTSRPILIPELELWKWKGDEETRKMRCRHLFDCLRITHWMLQWIPSNFDPRIKYSIAAMAEYFNFNLGTVVITSRWKDVQIQSWPWAAGVMTKGVRKRMIENRWCPSAIEETIAKFNGLGTLNLIGKMERGGPKRDHEMCTVRRCVNYQISNSTYKLSHAEEGCTCSTFEVDSQALTAVLMTDEFSLPLLKVIPGDDLQDLRIEIVPSSPNTPFVALSHVWADGLGNPYANSLHRCQIGRLKKLIEELDISSPPDETQNKPVPLLWVDTLCCPALNGPGKQASIKKLRRVYSLATAVLVLDASLFSLPSAPLHTSELLLRAYTSPWMRRLWTLQEGALNKNLFFQFADKAIAAQAMIETLKNIAWTQDARYFHPFMDIEREHLSIRSFFAPNRSSEPAFRQMETLEAALQTRSFSVDSDEPLCIATLLSLDLQAILKYSTAEERMRELWSLLAEKFGGIPASIVFYEDHCLPFTGWKWAPRSFFPHPKSEFDLRDRKRRWASGSRQLGLPSTLGLRCRYPGFKLSTTTAEKSDAWRGVYRPTETSVMFRDGEGVWYSLTKAHTPALGDEWYEKMAALRVSEGWVLRDAIETGTCAIVLEGEPTRKNGAERDTFRGILVQVKDSAGAEPGVMAVERKLHVSIATLYEEEAMVQETYRRVWLRMRGDEVAARLRSIKDEESVEFKKALREMADKMREVMKEELQANLDFKSAMPRLYGEKFDPGALWIMMANWWEQENIATKLPSEQVWCID